MPSHVIARFHYVAAERELTIHFRSGRIYVYADVPHDIYTAMQGAFAKGEFFNKHVRNKFRYVQRPRDEAGPEDGR